MASVPIDLSSYKPTAGDDLDAAKIANAMTAVESYTGSGLDPNALTQKGASIGQTLVWDGSKWAPGDQRYPVAPTILGPTGSQHSTATLTANQAYLYPIQVVAPTTITRLCFAISSGGATGNLDLGVYYSDDDATFTRLVSKGSTATPANGSPQTFTISGTTLTPVAGRRWYLAIACSSATPVFLAGSALAGCFQKGSSFPLPSSLTSVSALAVFSVFLYALV